ncbi:putative D(1B) dopamine receptor [Hypsibius exemplaris]|uniref:D(1B) dopamine receptor n=1 Tax=Hypsibius exemplaris TaxID=2072580 RepID=A0A9X6RLA7_HYPEX|nr:putative D(1B) dopamine receptor [Hypsibius exemplaris]
MNRTSVEGPLETVKASFANVVGNFTLPRRTLTEKQYNELYLWSGVTFIVVYGAAFGNLLTLTAIVRARWWRTGMQILIASLTACDFFISFFVYPCYIINIISGAQHFPHNNALFCRITGYIVLTTSYVTPIHCCMIAVNRLFAIVLPRWAGKMTNRAAGLIMAGLGWFIPAVVYLIPLIGVDGFYGNSQPFKQCAWVGFASSVAYQTASAILTLYAPTVVLAVCYGVIFFRLRCMDRVFHGDRERESVSRDGVFERKVREAKKMARRWSVAKMMLVTFIVFAICYIPMTTFFYVAGEDFFRPPLPTVLAWLFTVSYLGPFCNPIIYAVMNRDFHDAFVSILRCTPRAPRRGNQQAKRTSRSSRVGVMASTSREDPRIPSRVSSRGETFD